MGWEETERNQTRRIAMSILTYMIQKSNYEYIIMMMNDDNYDED